MSETLKTQISERLNQIIDPHTEKSIVQSGAIKGIAVVDQRVAIDVVLGYPALSWHQTLTAEIQSGLQNLVDIKSVSVSVSSRIHSHQVQNELSPLPMIKNIIPVASGKGGVGKSTTAVNLALALRAQGASVGILDADIYGPSVPTMLGVQGKPESTDGKTMQALYAYGLSLMSIGFLVDADTPMIWRGPMVTQALQQLLNFTAWPDLDYLIIDLPPGTGDIQLTLCQKVPISGAVIVTTPQDIALIDAKKAYKMFEKVGVPVLGIVENMSVHTCSQCGHSEAIFGTQGGQKMAEEYHLPLLAQLPLAMQIREHMDQGKPLVALEPEIALSQTYMYMARRVAAQLALRPRQKKIAFSNVIVENS